MKILIVSGKNVAGGGHEPPLGTASVAVYLRRKGHEVAFLDLGVLELIKKGVNIEKEIDGMDIVGFGCLSTNFQPVRELCQEIKLLNPDLPIVIGGIHATAMPRKVLSHREVDYVVIGEGEITMSELVECLEGNCDVSAIKGIGYKDKNGNMVINDRRPLVANLDSLPGLDEIYEILDVDEYATRRGGIRYGSDRVAQMIISRGCPYRCTFCAVKIMWGSTYRVKRPDKVVDEMVCLYNKLGLNTFYFDDSTFGIKKQWVLRFCEEVSKSILHKHVRWFCNSRVDCVDREILLKMKECGCDGLFFGVETGSPIILETLRKGFTVNQVLDAFELCEQLNIPANAYFMIGNPGETEGTIKETFQLADKISPVCFNWNICTPLPGSDLWEYALEKGYVTEDMDFDRIDFSKKPLVLDNLSAKQIERWFHYAKHHKYGDRYSSLFAKYSFLAHHFFNRLSKVRSVKDILNLLEAAWNWISREVQSKIIDLRER